MVENPLAPLTRSYSPVAVPSGDSCPFRHQRSIVTRLWLAAARTRDKVFSVPRKSGALLVAPSEEGSLGDEAILQSVVQNLRRNDFGMPIGLVTFGEPGQWRRIKGVDDYLDLTNFLNGWTAREWIAFARFTRNYHHLVLPGTDVLDGYYSVPRTLQRLTIAESSAAMGMDVSVMAFSINPNPDAQCMRAFRWLSGNVSLTCRDRLSAERLEHLSGRAAAVTADLAFLLESDEQSPVAARTIHWIESKKGCGREVYGINVNEHLMRGRSAAKQAALIGVIADVLCQLSWQRRVSFVFIPHDRRPEHDDTRTGRKLAHLLKDVADDDFLILDSSYTAAAIKAIVGHCDLLITGRMHVAIAALGEATPVACLTYQGKFEGLLEHFGISDAVISPEAAGRPRVLMDFLSAQISNLQRNRQGIKSQLGKVVELARANLRTIR